MKLFLVHLASLAVMFHMTFGCHWHHGLGAADACSQQSSCATSSQVSETEQDEDHGDDHDHALSHDNHEDADTPLALAVCNDGADQEHDHSHFCCHDDGCSLIKVVEDKFSSLALVTRYHGGACVLAILKSASASFPVDSYPGYRLYAPSVRAHLLLGVQLI